MHDKITRLALPDAAVSVLPGLSCFRAWFAWLSLSLVLSLCLLSSFARAQQETVLEDQEIDREIDEEVVRLAGLVAEVVPGMLGYTRWPEEISDKRLCVLGPTEYADALLQTGIAVSGWQTQVQRVSVDYDYVALNCQAIYIGVLLEDERNAILSRLGSQPILSISEQNDSCVVNTLFCLRVEDGHVGFAVNLDSVGRSGLRVHPNVLRLGRLPGEAQ